MKKFYIISTIIALVLLLAIPAMINQQTITLESAIKDNTDDKAKIDKLEATQEEIVKFLNAQINNSQPVK
jgi:predicted PurR-regulated permease PerM